MFRRERERAETEVLIARHRRGRVVAGEALGKHDLLVSRQCFTPTREPEPNRPGMSIGTQPVSAPGREKLARDVIRMRRP